jgi:hypothetical protein
MIDVDDADDLYDDDDEGRYDDPFDNIVLSYEQAKELCKRVTGNKLDCECVRATPGYKITWVWTEVDRKGKTRYLEYNIWVPRRRPMELKVAASSSNYNYYVSTAARRQRYAEVAATVLKHLGEMLRIDLTGYEPDPERARLFSENGWK